MPMSREEIKTKLEAILRDVFGDPALAITEATTASDVSDWDSLNHINIIVAVEEAFGIRFATREVYVANNVGEFVNLIAKKLQP